jgi:hypothetical protein
VSGIVKPLEPKLPPRVLVKLIEHKGGIHVPLVLQDCSPILKKVVIVIGAARIERPRQSGLADLPGSAQESQFFPKVFFKGFSKGSHDNFIAVDSEKVNTFPHYIPEKLI